jgi:sulfate/thiosulfate-binding protein
MNLAKHFARVVALVLAAAAFPAGAAERELTLLNVSYDPTRELWRDVNEHFIADYKAKAGVTLTINQSHGGSSTQARAVIDGLEADVVSLASYIDTNAIAKRGLIKSPWIDRLPNHSLPYTSTIVFVVRKGNPWKIQDWPDLVKPGVEIVTPNPKTSGNGYLTFFSAWGSVVLRGGTEDQAKAFLAELYKHVPVLDSGARGATTTFVQKRIGDVHLAWENEARLEVQEAKGGLEIVYPPISILAEPFVAVVDATVDRAKGHRAAAEAYLAYLYTDEGQNIIAKHYYRPSNAAVLQAHAADFPNIELFPITKIAPGWEEAQKRFTGDGGLFDTFYKPGQ